MTPAKIRAAREAVGETQAQFADRLGVSLDTVRSWEQGRRRPCCRYMVAAIRALTPRRGRIRG